MLRLDFHRDASSTTVLCLGAHCDDIEIGCGGTILKLLETHGRVICHWVVFSSDARRAAEAKQSADLFLATAKSKHIEIDKFRQSFFPYIGAKLKERFERLKDEVSPDVVFTPYWRDMHQDHRLISELTWNTFRDHLILEYEIPKYDGDFGSPNVFVPLDRSTCRAKIQYILQCFPSQKARQWFDSETFWSVLRLRGMESNAESRYAEAFYGRKLLLGSGDASRSIVGGSSAPAGTVTTRSTRTPSSRPR